MNSKRSSQLFNKFIFDTNKVVASKFLAVNLDLCGLLITVIYKQVCIGLSWQTLLNASVEFCQKTKHSICNGFDFLGIIAIFAVFIYSMSQKVRIKLVWLQPDLHVLQSQDFFKGIYPLIQDQETKG
ncbi:hypothetical protein BpHYR1_014226 [Brachionus plicatilis]|uniref:Uncharacterized protein n=1 Tax=Brachionus plicatilis TaxID=10195 RepID=A0A3M7SBM7_BRAPC|nr:hypothetical protein BpHYR1_014226 [Brachionus plicatilis]